MFVAFTGERDARNFADSLHDYYNLGLRGSIYRFDERLETVTSNPMRHWRQIGLPYGVKTKSTRISTAQYGSRLYIAGGYTDNLVLDEHERLHKLGMTAPSYPPVVTGTTGSGVIAYTSFWDELTEEYGPLSGGSEIGDTGTRTWENLPTYEINSFAFPSGWCYVDQDDTFPTSDNSGQYPTTDAPLNYLMPGDKVYVAGETVAVLRYPDGRYDAQHPLSTIGWKAHTFDAANLYTGVYGKPAQRPSHICLWLSVAGGLPRLVGKARLGATTVTESVSVSNLGEAHPGFFERFPTCSINAIYHDRLVMAGDPDALDTVYLSALGFPERWEGLKFRTRGGEEVTALVSTRDYCLIMTDNTTYLLQGFTENDLNMTPVDNGVGAVSHFTNQVVHGTPYVANKHGIFMYNGTWNQTLTAGSRSYARHFSDNTFNYRNAVMYHNPVDKTVQLVLGKSRDRQPFYIDRFLIDWTDGRIAYVYEQYAWVLGYETIQPQAGGGFTGSQLSFDRYYCPDLGVFNSFLAPDMFNTQAYLPSMNGGSNYMWHGTLYGWLYVEHPEETFLGESVIMTPTYLFDQAGGFEGEGKTLAKFWTHCSSENTTWYACPIGGDEWVGFQSFLGSASAGADQGTMLGRRLWCAAPNRIMQDIYYGIYYPKAMTTRKGFGVEHYADEISPTLLTGTGTPVWGTADTTWVATPKSVHEHPLPEYTSGRGVCFLYYFNNPKGVMWRGVGGYVVPGPVTRPTFYLPDFTV